MIYAPNYHAIARFCDYYSTNKFSTCSTKNLRLFGPTMPLRINGQTMTTIIFTNVSEMKNASEYDFEDIGSLEIERKNCNLPARIGVIVDREMRRRHTSIATRVLRSPWASCPYASFL